MMQIDMHFYGTYALARAAGLAAEAAEIIATAAQYVDDSEETEVEVHKSGARFTSETTAHHPSGLAEIIAINNPDDQRRVWVPFHFLPGGDGEELTQKLTCRKDSAIARAMVEHHLELAKRPYALELLGIAAHVYADTFAHYGFSGVSSRRNRVVGNKIKIESGAPVIQEYLGERLIRFFNKFGEQGGILDNIRSAISGVGELASGSLGHGAVATYPDQPYLHWSFKYEHPDLIVGPATSERENLKDYMEACEKLHAMFRNFAERRPDLTDGTGGRDFASIKQTVESILAFEGRSADRIWQWREAVGTDRLYQNGPDIDFPEYERRDWDGDRDALMELPDPAEARDFSVYRFYQAAALHREYVLRDLLPDNGIVVI